MTPGRPDEGCAARRGPTGMNLVRTSRGGDAPAGLPDEDRAARLRTPPRPTRAPPTPWTCPTRPPSPRTLWTGRRPRGLVPRRRAHTLTTSAAWEAPPGVGGVGEEGDGGGRGAPGAATAGCPSGRPSGEAAHSSAADPRSPNPVDVPRPAALAAHSPDQPTTPANLSPDDARTHSPPAPRGKCRRRSAASVTGAVVTPARQL